MEQSQNLEQVLDGIFAGTATRFTTSAGNEVIFNRAGIVQLGKITKFINLIIENTDKQKIDAFLQLVAKEQTAMLAEGKSVQDINLNSAGLLTKALKNHNLLLDLFGMFAAELPEFISIFSTCTADDYEALALDEQLVIAAGILIVNYAFFTQSLPPIMRSIAKALSAKNASKGKQQQPAKK